MPIAKVNSKPMNKAPVTIGDLHVKKESHMAMPIRDNEWHLKAEDVNEKCKPGENYTICVAVVCTSADKEGTRFRQIAKPYIDKNTKFDEAYDTDGGAS
jgi:hypothetical protein